MIENEDLRVKVLDGLIPMSLVTQLQEKCPDFENPDAETLRYSSIPVGPVLGLKWNTPANESYIQQGVLVKPSIPPPYFVSSHWRETVALSINLDAQSIFPLSWQYRSHTGASNGVWLHTDRQADSLRAVLVLIYLAKENTNDGALLLFSPGSETQSYVKGYQHGRPLYELLNIQEIGANTIGGEYKPHARRWDLKARITPAPGRVVIMDHTKYRANVHAVEPCTGLRQVAQQWWGQKT